MPANAWAKLHSSFPRMPLPDKASEETREDTSLLVADVEEEEKAPSLESVVPEADKALKVEEEEKAPSLESVVPETDKASKMTEDATFYSGDFRSMPSTAWAKLHSSFPSSQAMQAAGNDTSKAVELATKPISVRPCDQPFHLRPSATPTIWHRLRVQPRGAACEQVEEEEEEEEDIDFDLYG